ncbi:hypothetical protein CR513_10636, partial [Mucuna pruriens]
MNVAVEVANKNIKKIVPKMVVTYKNWHDMLPYALHGFQTLMCTSTGATPYSLVYNTKAVLPVEVEIPSFRVLSEAELDDAEWIKNAFDKKVRPRVFKDGDLVLKKILPNSKDTRGKWAPNYEGPYIVKHAFSGGALILADSEGCGQVVLPFKAQLEKTPKGQLPSLQDGGVNLVRYGGKRYQSPAGSIRLTVGLNDPKLLRGSPKRDPSL